MATHRFRPTRYFNVIGTAEPCLRVVDGDTLIADTVDASGLDASEVAVAERPNPMTGPFFIEGAEPGDTLAVRIDRLTPSRATGWTLSPLAFTVLDPAAIPDRPPTERVVWIIDANAGTVRLREPPQGLENFAPAIQPMIGCFGVAPARGQALSTAPVRRTAATWIIACLRPARPHGSRSRCQEHSFISAMATPARATVRLSAPGSRPPSIWR